MSRHSSWPPTVKKDIPTEDNFEDMNSVKVGNTMNVDNVLETGKFNEK